MPSVSELVWSKIELTVLIIPTKFENNSIFLKVIKYVVNVSVCVENYFVIYLQIAVTHKTQEIKPIFM